MTTQNKVVLFFTVVIIVVAIVYLDRMHVRVAPGSAAAVSIATTTAQSKVGKYPPAVEIADPTGFVNTGGLPITLSQYIGKDIIVIDFMTYSCINCQRTFPYLEAWYQKYKDQGLIVIGIHTPEFEFEKDITNVTAAMQRFGITFPVVLDSNYGTWNAYQNEYWPHEFVIDIDGYIREDHVGEGGYADTEKTIQSLLDERDTRLGITPSFDTSIVNPTGAITSIEAQSPETYFGSNRNKYLGNGTVGKSGVQNFTIPLARQPYLFYFGGSWDVESEYAESQSSNSKIVYTYQAMAVYFVAGTKDSKTSVIAEVTLDGQPIPPGIRGSDVFESNNRTYVKIQENRLYDLVHDVSAGANTIEIDAQGAGLQAYTFTFG